MKIGSKTKHSGAVGGGAASSLREQRNMLCDRMNFSAAEAYKMLRTNLMFALPDENRCRIVGVTSSLHGEGKSTTSINLAYTLAETGKEVLLIDADMRLPSVAKKFALTQSPGLSNVLAGLSKAGDVLQTPLSMMNWRVLPAGDIPPNPSELLGSEQMHMLLKALAEKFDFIVVDLPPANIVSDAMVLGNWIDGLLVVVREGYSNRAALSTCMNKLSVLQSKVLGFVMTDVAEKGKEYGRRYGKYYKSYGYGSYGYSSAYAYAKAGQKRKNRNQQATRNDIEND